MVKNQTTQCPKCHTDVRNDTKSKHTQKICERNLSRHFFQTACPHKCSKWTDRSNVSRHLRSCRLNPKSPKFQGEKPLEQKCTVYKQTISNEKQPTEKPELPKKDDVHAELIVLDDDSDSQNLICQSALVSEQKQCTVIDLEDSVECNPPEQTKEIQMNESDGKKIRKRKRIRKVSAFSKMRDQKTKTQRWHRLNVRGLTKAQVKFQEENSFAYGDTKCYICYGKMNFKIHLDTPELVMGCMTCHKNIHTKCMIKSMRDDCPHCRGKMDIEAQVSLRVQRLDKQLDDQWINMTQQQKDPFYLKAHEFIKNMTPAEIQNARQQGTISAQWHAFQHFYATRVKCQMEKFYKQMCLKY